MEDYRNVRNKTKFTPMLQVEILKSRLNRKLWEVVVYEFDTRDVKIDVERQITPSFSLLREEINSRRPQ